MATWQELSSDCLRSAKVLLDNGLLRRSISSAYYAAYCAVTSHLVAHGVDFAHGWNNPAHEQLPNLVLNNTTLPRNTRYQINKAIRRLRMAREDADYRPAVIIDRRRALDCLHDAGDVLQLLGVNVNGTE